MSRLPRVVLTVTLTSLAAAALAAGQAAAPPQPARPATPSSIAAPAASPRPDGAALHHWLGVEHHTRRRLDEASREYARTLALDAGRDLTPDEQRLVRRFAPRLYTTPTEFFALRDVAVVLDPDRRLIAYHLFWDDDIDFPEDNDPCDHEVLWVRYSRDARDIEQVWAYFHGQLLRGTEATLKEARANGMRPRIHIQWGKHGSIPMGAEQQRLRLDPDDAAALERRSIKVAPDRGVTVAQVNEWTFQTLSKEGRRLRGHPIGRRLGWPERFAGTFEQFTDFSKAVDPIAWLDRTHMERVSRWNSATINQHFLAFNFRPKLEWPPDSGDAAGDAPAVPAASTPIAAFQLPAKSVFDAAMPRYPNVWIYLDASLADSYRSAVALVTGMLRTTMRLEERFGPFSNPEACDFEGGLEHLQPWQTREQRDLQHGHAFHIRYYYSALEKQGLERVTLQTPAGPRPFYRVPTSAHYEVEHHNPHHADVELCPICGRTGAYADVKGSLVEMVHDPLGVELALTGTIRGERVVVDPFDPLPLRGAAAFNNQFSAQQFLFPAAAPDQNTLRIGVIVITPPTGR